MALPPALNGGQTNNFYNRMRRSCWVSSATSNKSVQNELMTAREWQHAMFFRDRWSATSKLTLDLGLRWEYYPIMHRVDGRGLDRLDLTTLEVIVAGRGGNPQNNGMRRGPGQLRAARGRYLSLQRQDSPPQRVRSHVQRAAVGARGAWRQRLSSHHRVDVRHRRYSSATSARCSRGFRGLSGPDISSGRVPLDRAAAEYTPEIDNIDRGYVHTWNVAVERRLAYDISVDVAYVGAKGVGGYAALDINAPLTLGGGNNSRPYASMGASSAIDSWGQRLRTRLRFSADCAQQAVYARACCSRARTPWPRR